MRKLIESTLVSLDGVIESPERWARFDEESAALAMEQLDDYDAFVMGRVTYERLSANYAHLVGNPYIDRIDSVPKHVASRALRDPGWNATVLGPDAAGAIARLKQQPGKDLIKYGTSRLDNLRVRERLVDELHLWYMPVVVGADRQPGQVDVVRCERLLSACGDARVPNHVPNSAILSESHPLLPDSEVRIYAKSPGNEHLLIRWSWVGAGSAHRAHGPRDERYRCRAVDGTVGIQGYIRAGGAVLGLTLTMLVATASAHAAGWRIGSPPSLTASASMPATLSAVSCPSATECVAVGSYLDSSGNPDAGPLVEVSNGSGWTVPNTPTVSGGGLMPSGATSDPAELWNGSTWTAEPLPGFTSHGTALPVASLSGVSCVPSGVCDAVGYHSTYGEQGSEVVTAEWNAGAWSDQQEPASTHTNALLVALSCLAAPACDAVGSEAEGFNGAVWSPQNLSLPAGGSLQGDSCTSPTACVAVGEQTGNSGKANRIFADTFDGTAWTPAPIATPRSASLPDLTGISCATGTSCTAVGFDTDAAGVSVPLVLTDSGSGWTPAATPSLAVADPSSSLTAVSCAAPGSCMAVGTDAAGVLTLRSLAGHFSPQTAPNPGKGSDASNTMPAPASIACPARRTCLMVGSYTNAAGNDDGFAERWNGTSWALQHTPGQGSDTATTLGAVSCPSVRQCIASGSRADSVGEPMSSTTSAMTEQWSGLDWSYQTHQPGSPAQGAGESPDNELTGLSCSSSHRCTAVGYATTGGSCRRCGNLAERLNGRVWALQRPSQAGTTDGNLQGVACPSATRCVAVGPSAAQVWNGVTWAFTRIHGTVTSVSCPTKRHCIAVGTDSHRVLVERWNGVGWSPQSAPDPRGATRIAVTGVSCPTAGACVLVGSDRTGGHTVSLIETYG